MKKIVLAGIALFILNALHSQVAVKWYTIEEAYALSKKEPRKILVDVYTDWCGWCKVMDRNTYSNEVIADYINKTFYAVKFNAEQKGDVLLNGKTYKLVQNGNRSYNQFAYELLKGQLGYPSTVFLDEQANVIEPVQGYIKPVEFDQILKFIGSNAFKTKKWEDFKSTYVSPITEVTQ